MEPSRLELWLLRIAAGCLAGSVALGAAFFVLVAAFFISPVGALGAGVVVLAYLVQAWCLGRMGSRAARPRLGFWQVSLFAHLVVFGAVLALVRSPGAAALILAPEVVSAACHLVAIVHLRRAVNPVPSNGS